MLPRKMILIYYIIIIIIIQEKNIPELPKKQFGYSINIAHQRIKQISPLHPSLMTLSSVS